MRWATCFLPSWSTLETSWVTSCDPNTGSTSSGRFGAGPLRGISALLLLRAVPAASLLAVLHALGVERAADDLVADTGEVLHPASADEHDRVLLEVVTDARDVRRDLDAARQAHAGDLAEGGVRLLRGGGVDAGADPATLRTALEGRRLGLRRLVLAALADQLVDGGHSVVPFRSFLSTRRRAGHDDRAWCVVTERVLTGLRWPRAHRAARTGRTRWSRLLALRVGAKTR